MGKRAKQAEEIVEEEPVEALPVKKKKKKAQEEVAAEEEAPVISEKKKKKKQAAAEAEEEEEAPVVSEKKKKKKEKAAEAEEEEEAPVVSEKKKKAKTEAAEDADGKTYTVCMRGLPWAVDEAKLRKDCGELGDITDLKLLMKEDGSSRGIAFVSFRSKEAFDKCCEWNETEYEGRTVYVVEAESRPSKGKGKGSGEKPDGCTSLFLRGLKESAEEDDLWTFFEDLETGPSRIKILTDRG